LRRKVQDTIYLEQTHQVRLWIDQVFVRTAEKFIPGPILSTIM